MQQSADATEVDEQAVGLHSRNLALYQLAHFQILEAFGDGGSFFGQHQLARLRIDLDEGHAQGLTHQLLVIFTVLELGAGNEAPQPFEIAGDTAAVEAIDDDLNHFSLFLHLLDPIPAFAQLQGATADRDHSISVLLTGYQNFNLQALGEALSEVGHNTKA